MGKHARFGHTIVHAQFDPSLRDGLIAIYTRHIASLLCIGLCKAKTAQRTGESSVPHWDYISLRLSNNSLARSWCSLACSVLLIAALQHLPRNASMICQAVSDDRIKLTGLLTIYLLVDLIACVSLSYSTKRKPFVLWKPSGIQFSCFTSPRLTKMA
jgi:hypothetical protein